MSIEPESDHCSLFPLALEFANLDNKIYNTTYCLFQLINYYRNYSNTPVSLLMLTDANTSRITEYRSDVTQTIIRIKIHDINFYLFEPVNSSKIVP